ncbi:uncharacterized protein [Palaemon carinicauda]|uniref:uncharacterized protein n=1 Tax=Palaemon carinicauda TaxID=392227 RepID=UPI0035B59118
MEGSPRSRISLHPQAREIVYRIVKYFDKEKANHGPVMDVRKTLKRTSEATMIPERTISRICKEGKVTGERYGKPIFVEQKKQQPRTVTNLDDFDKSVLRRTVLDFYARKEVPTLDSITAELKENIEFKGSRDSVHKVHEIGFRYSKVNGRKFLLERKDVASARTKFLREMKALKTSGYKSFVYLDETWINQNHTVGKCWIDINSENATGIKPPTGKGSRLIVLHAGTERGFVPNCELVFQSKNDGDYHKQMNHTVFKEWFISQLIPNIPPSSIIVMDNASYHSFQIDKPPTTSDRKAVIKDWLIEKGETPGDDLLKDDLLAMVKQHTSRWPRKYEINIIASKHGHKVVRLPPYHCQYNPIELIWSQVKQYVAKKNNFKMSDLKSLISEALQQVTPENWKNAVNRAETSKG